MTIFAVIMVLLAAYVFVSGVYSLWTEGLWADYRHGDRRRGWALVFTVLFWILWLVTL